MSYTCLFVFNRWRCQTYIKGVTFRSPPTPDLSECRSVWLSSLEGRLHQGDSIISIANDLSQVYYNKYYLIKFNFVFKFLII